MFTKTICPTRHLLLATCLALRSALAVAAPTVADFGATGDGEMDDTTAIQSAVASGAPLVFSPGVYRITAPIVINLNSPGYMGVSGASGATRIVMESAGPALHFIGSHAGTANPTTVNPGVWERERFPVISDLEVQGVHAEAEGIRLEGTMQCAITRVLIRNCLHGIRLVNRNRNLIVSDSHLYENRATGIFFDQVNLHQVNIIGNHISYGGGAGILVRGGEVRNIQITGNDIEYNHHSDDGATDIFFDTREGTLREFTITGNTVQAVPSENGANIRIYGAAADRADLSGLGTIAGNLIGSQTVNIDLMHTRGVAITGNSIYSGAALSIRARRCHNLTIAGNTVDYNPGSEDKMRDGFHIESCGGVVISANSLTDCRAGAPEQGGAISIVDSRDVLVGNCVIIDPAHRGIDVRNCASCSISGNIIRDAREPATMIEAIAVDEDSKQIIMDNNLLPETGIGAALDMPQS